MTPGEKQRKRKASQAKYYEKKTHEIKEKRRDKLTKEAKLAKFRNSWQEISTANLNREIAIQIVDHLISAKIPQRSPTYQLSSDHVGSAAWGRIVDGILGQKQDTREYHTILYTTRTEAVADEGGGQARGSEAVGYPIMRSARGGEKR